MSEYKPPHEVRRTLKAALGARTPNPYAGHPSTSLCARRWYTPSQGTSATCYRCCKVIHCERRVRFDIIYAEHRETCSFYQQGKKNVSVKRNMQIMLQTIMSLLQQLSDEHKTELMMYILHEISSHKKTDILRARALIGTWLQETAQDPAAADSNDGELISTPSSPEGANPRQSNPPPCSRSDPTASADGEIAAASSSPSLASTVARPETSRVDVAPRESEPSSLTADNHRTRAFEDQLDDCSLSAARDHSGATAPDSSFETSPRGDIPTNDEENVLYTPHNSPDNDTHRTTHEGPSHSSSSEQTSASFEGADDAAEIDPEQGSSQATPATANCALAEEDCRDRGTETQHTEDNGTQSDATESDVSEEASRGGTAEGAAEAPALLLPQAGHQEIDGGDAVSLRTVRWLTEKFDLGQRTYKLSRRECRALLDSMGTSLAPQKPEYSTIARRRSTFPSETFPDTGHRNPQWLAEAGFFYAGHHDQVTCYHCGNTLQEWNTLDQLKRRHRKYFPNCRLPASSGLPLSA